MGLDLRPKSSSRWPFRLAIAIVFGLCGAVLLRGAWNDQHRDRVLVLPPTPLGVESKGYIVDRTSDPDAHAKAVRDEYIAGLLIVSGALLVLFAKGRRQDP